MNRKKWYLVKKNTHILIVASAYNQKELEDKLQGMDNPDKYEVLSAEEVYRRIKE